MAVVLALLLVLKFILLLIVDAGAMSRKAPNLKIRGLSGFQLGLSAWKFQTEVMKLILGGADR
ncbi:hypothetical protein BJB45_14945 [Halomonas huangheensis]|uniref:Uncharacterized protein n=1 Tax=Halomonas huangheensis TaxID=1178482 RepID=W1N7M9_9GAMM|nr:hypothetical protein AR456_01135 [Halomonas huangheensis]ERL51196.1 hypothetical protein BJB45_14945 [Halomonas huangheensis]